MGRKQEGEEAAPKVDLKQYVGQEVTVVGKGFERERDGKKYRHIVEITQVEAVAAAPAAE